HVAQHLIPMAVQACVSLIAMAFVLAPHACARPIVPLLVLSAVLMDAVVLAERVPAVNVKKAFVLLAYPIAQVRLAVLMDAEALAAAVALVFNVPQANV